MTRTRTSFFQEQGLWSQMTRVDAQSDPNVPVFITATTSQLELPAPTGGTALVAVSKSLAQTGTITSFTTIAVDAGGFPKGLTTTTTDSITSNLDAVSVSAHGYPISATSHLSALPETWTYAETASGLTTTHTNVKGGVSRNITNALGQVIDVRNPINLRVLYEYGTDPSHPSIGRLISTTNGENETTTYDYDILGRKSYQGGATYPVAYNYDPISRMTNMVTFRDQAAGADSITAWSYNPHSGLLGTKLYDCLLYTSPSPRD